MQIDMIAKAIKPGDFLINLVHLFSAFMDITRKNILSFIAYYSLNSND
jgi:hypothetical protein